MKKLIIIPAYNEEDSIEKLLNELDNNYKEYDYLVVNDCSKDATKAILQKRNAPYIDLPTNLGIGGGVQSGYIYAYENGYDIAIQMDGDGQHMPEYLQEIVLPIEKKEADFVVGSRFIKNEGFQSSAIRRVGINFLSNVLRMLTGVRVYDITSGFRAVNRTCIELFANEYAQDYPEPEALALAAMKGIRIKEVAVQMKERDGGVSSISGFKSIYYMIKVTLALIITTYANKRK